jgi:putative transposase
VQKPWYLPDDFPPWTAVYKQYQRWKKEEVFEKINHEMTKATRIKMGRNEDPSAAIVDSQSVKTTEKGGLKGTTAQKK